MEAEIMMAVACSYSQVGNCSEIKHVSVGMILTFWQLSI